MSGETEQVVPGTLPSMSRAIPARAYARRRDYGPRRRGIAWLAGLGGSLLAVSAGTALGLALTAVAIRHGDEVGAQRIGPWRVGLQEGTPAINPYQRAALARSGAVPMSVGQGMAFQASRDTAGHRLDRRCTYTVGSAVPRARFWTLGVVDADGSPIPNGTARYAFTSDNLLRDESGGFTLTLSPEAQPGNWIPLSGSGDLRLVLRLYDSVVSGLGAHELAALALPSITTVRCR